MNVSRCKVPTRNENTACVWVRGIYFLMTGGHIWHVRYTMLSEYMETVHLYNNTHMQTIHAHTYIFLVLTHSQLPDRYTHTHTHISQYSVVYTHNQQQNLWGIQEKKCYKSNVNQTFDPFSFDFFPSSRFLLLFFFPNHLSWTSFFSCLIFLCLFIFSHYIPLSVLHCFTFYFFF